VVGEQYYRRTIGRANLLMCVIEAQLDRCRNGVSMRLLSAGVVIEDSMWERNRGVTGKTLEDRVLPSGKSALDRIVVVYVRLRIASPFGLRQ
jgi:hypothetical protein